MSRQQTEERESNKADTITTPLSGDANTKHYIHTISADSASAVPSIPLIVHKQDRNN